jgi:uncharacterized protein (DUF488 family)
VEAILTVGHGTLDAEAFSGLLRRAGVATVVDVRRYPGSRRHPDVGRAEIERWLPEAGIAYRWLPTLGGRRAPVPGSPNVGLRQPQFRAYADHMASAEFAAGIAELLALAEPAPTAAGTQDDPGDASAGGARARNRGPALPAGTPGIGSGPVAIMCAESLWWRCHRRLVADHLVLVSGRPVEHLFHDGRLVRHAPTPEARRDGDRVLYDVGVQRPLLDP